VAAATLKSCDPSDRHRLAAEIFYKYVDSSVSLVRLEKSIIKGMEGFLIGEMLSLVSCNNNTLKHAYAIATF